LGGKLIEQRKKALLLRTRLFLRCKPWVLA